MIESLELERDKEEEQQREIQQQGRNTAIGNRLQLLRIKMEEVHLPRVKTLASGVKTN